MRDHDLVRQETGGEDVEGAVDRVPGRSSGQTGRAPGVDGVVDRADERRLLVPDGCQVDLADAGRAEQQHGAVVGNGPQ